MDDNEDENEFDEEFENEVPPEDEVSTVHAAFSESAAGFGQQADRNPAAAARHGHVPFAGTVQPPPLVGPFGTAGNPAVMMMLPDPVRQQHDKARHAFKMAAECVSAFTPTMSVDTWVWMFKDNVEQYGLSENDALNLFFLKVKEQTWITEFRDADRKKNKRVSVAHWLERMERSFKAARSSRLQAVKNRVQEETENPEAFVNSFVAQAKAADHHIHTEDLVDLLVNAIHPKWKGAYEVCTVAAKTPRDVIDGLTKAMSRGMDGIRSLLAAQSAVQNPVASNAVSCSAVREFGAGTPRTAPPQRNPAQFAFPSRGTSERGRGRGRGVLRGAGHSFFRGFPASTGPGMGRGTPRPWSGLTPSSAAPSATVTVNPSGFGLGRGIRSYSGPAPADPEAPVFCFHCNYPGHIKRFCPFLDPNATWINCSENNQQVPNSTSTSSPASNSRIPGHMLYGIPSWAKPPPSAPPAAALSSTTGSSSRSSDSSKNA